MKYPRSLRATWLLGLPLLLVLLAAVACGEDATPTPTATTPPQPTATTAAPSATDIPAATATARPVGRASVAEGAIGYGMVGKAIQEFGEPVYGGELGVQYWSKVQRWDPHPIFSARSSVFSPPYNSLLQLNPWTFDRFDIWGDLAESWKQENDEGTVWSFKIKPHATFRDGTPVTAEDVHYSFQRALGLTPNHPDLGNEFKNFIRPHYESSEVVDPLTFRITLNAPWADFLLFMANDLILTVPKAHYEDSGCPDGRG